MEDEGVGDSKPDGAGRARGRFQNLLVMVGSIAVSLAFAECGLRLYHHGNLAGLSGEHSVRIPHPVRGWTLDAGGAAFQRTKDYGVHVRINSKGLRDREHAYEPAPGVFRIVILGDSYMEAYQVPLEDSLPYLLQERLAERKVEVVNLGVGGYGTAQQFLYLRDEGLRYRPDLVVLAFFLGNDVHNNSRVLQEMQHGEDALKVFGRPYARPRGLEGEINWTMPDAERVRPLADAWRRRRTGTWRTMIRLLQPAMVANVVERATGSLAERFAGHAAYDPNVAYGWPFLEAFAPSYAAPGLSTDAYKEIWDEAWLATRRVILEIDRLAASQGADFVVMAVPEIFQVDRAFLESSEALYPGLAFDETRINRELRRFAGAHGIGFLDLTPAFMEGHSRDTRPLYYLIEDHHWNSEGHELAAVELAGYLDREQLIPAPSGRVP